MQRASLERRLANAERTLSEATAKLAEMRAELEARRVELAPVIAEGDELVEAYGRGHPSGEEGRARAQGARRMLADLQATFLREQPAIEAAAAQAERDVGDLRRQLDTVTSELAAAEQSVRELESREQAAATRAIRAELEEIRPAVDAAREAAGRSGFKDLSREYVDQGDGHRKSWMRWGGLLLLAIGGAIAGSLMLFSSESVPSGDIDSETIVTLARNLLIVGLMLYVVRLCSLQFRVHRHLEAVARNKAAALSTFSRIVAVASEREVRTAIAAVLAQAVFSSDETGFVDGGSDHITLVERIAGGVPRPGA